MVVLFVYKNPHFYKKILMYETVILNRSIHKKCIGIMNFAER